MQRPGVYPPFPKKRDMDGFRKPWRGRGEHFSRWLVGSHVSECEEVDPDCWKYALEAIIKWLLSYYPFIINVYYA